MSPEGGQKAKIKTNKWIWKDVQFRKKQTLKTFKESKWRNELIKSMWTFTVFVVEYIIQINAEHQIYQFMFCLIFSWTILNHYKRKLGKFWHYTTF